jgi:ribonuclease D
MAEFGDFQIFEQDLSALALEEYLQAEAIAVDTETMGLLPWRDRLCLVQICDPQGRVSVVRIAQGQKAEFEKIIRVRNPQGVSLCPFRHCHDAPPFGHSNGTDFLHQNC